ncbi:DUF3999 family protein [Xenorhabdus bovienii]|uniref:DUF3999 family protein n=1 Tax=Xenorhabdus bovienii TaxID=40576 RepID=UPI0023B24EF8|nr:DUF3999 family protein [Xenorhabdus bovienii]MDE9535100.1 DUF3999 domain-containing protein [Xenorhabdus bovienii]MDE9589242.1 DUF3999 domain-containing protein [Xenorhabdus bovienii]
MRLKAVSDSWGSESPIVIGKRDQVQLIFNAQGNAPYLLAWGDNLASTAVMDIGLLIPKGEMPANGIRGLPEAKVKNEMVLGGKERLTAKSQIEKNSQWQKWLLWGTLILGVLGLAFIALKLAREMMANKEQ